jgi:hypothetical protein
MINKHVFVNGLAFEWPYPSHMDRKVVNEEGFHQPIHSLSVFDMFSLPYFGTQS